MIRLPGTIAGATAAALVGGALECALMASRAHPTGAALLATLGAWVLLIPLLLIGVLVGNATARRPVLQQAWAALKTADWPRPASTIAAGLVAMTTVFAASKLGLRIVQGGLQDMGLLPPLAVVVLLGATVVGGGLAVWLHAPIQAGFRRLPRRPALLGLALLSVATLAVLLRPAWRILFVARSAAPLILLGFALVVALALSRRIARWRIVLPLVAVSIGLLVGGLSVARQPQIAAPIATTDAAADRVLGIARRLTDRDGDGFSSTLGERDCNDADATVNPLAADLPGNGIDEDCNGRDATLETIKRVPVKHAELPPKMQGKWNILLITVDTLRPDHLGAYGYARKTSRNIDALARNGFVFEHVWAAASKTSDSVPALMTGRFISEMETDRRSKPAWILPSNDLIMERFARAGWYTHAAMVSMFTDAFFFGIDQGIETLETSKIDFNRVSAPALTDLILKGWDAWDQADDPRPFFSWVHYNEPHARYVKHEGYDFGDSDMDRYDSEIAFVDNQIGRLIQGLQDRNLLKKTIVVLTSDHGEAFLEHGQPYHGRALYEEAIRVPLIIRVPRQKGRKVGGPVSIIDIPETLANLAGLPPGDAPSAVSLVGAMASKKKVPPRDIWMDSFLHQDKPNARLLGVVRWPYKAVLDFRNGRMTLFNLKDDPGERVDLTEEDPARTARFGALIRARMARYNQGEVMRAIADRRSAEPPEGVSPEGQPMAEGVEWLGGWIERSEKRRFNVLRSWFRATGTRRPDYKIRVDIKDRTGKWRLKRDLRPVVGRYPTHRWQSGEVIEDIRWLKAKGRPPYTATVQLLRAGKPVGEVKTVLMKPKPTAPKP